MSGQIPPNSDNSHLDTPRRSQTGKLGSVMRLLFSARTFSELPRLFREGTGPVVRLCVQAHNTWEITRLVEHGTPVWFVSSFPRSGNTWARYLLADVFLQSHGVETTTDLPIHPDQILPDFYCNWIAKRNVEIAMPGVFIKMHDSFERLAERFGGASAGAAFRQCRHIYFYRAPEDALVSLYHYSGRQKQLKASTACSIDTFCMAKLASWENNLASYLRAADSGIPVLFVPYELLLQYPGEILSNMLGWIGMEQDRSTVERAVSNMQFSKLKALDSGKQFNEESFFFRRGCKGSGQSELQPATLKEIVYRTSDLLARANQRVMSQHQPHRIPASGKTGQIRRDVAVLHRLTGRLKPVTHLQKA